MLVFDALRDDILWLRIAPGSAIDEVALADRFKVSRTPVREALLMLQSEWLVQFLPNRTSIVAPLLLNNAGQYFDAHLVLARSVGRAAALSRRANRAQLVGLVDTYEASVGQKDFAAALEVSLALFRNLTDLTGNIFLERYFQHSLDAGIRTKILHYFPNAQTQELRQAGSLMSVLVEAVVSGDADASDNAVRALIVQEIEIIMRSLQPSFGDAMSVEALEVGK